jgi:hypothetical protein
VASLSGFVDPQWSNAAVVQAGMAYLSFPGENGDHDPAPIYGPAEGFYADGHNPTLLVRNLQHTRVFVSTGTGVPSSADPNPPQADITNEHIIYPMSVAYHQALVAAGIPATYQVHPGAHDGPDFLAEIRAMLRWALQAGGHRPRVLDEQHGRDKRLAVGLQLQIHHSTDTGRAVQTVRDHTVDQRRRLVGHDHYGQWLCHPHLDTSDRAPAKPRPGLVLLARQSRSQGMPVITGQLRSIATPERKKPTIR